MEGQLNKYTNVVKGWQYRWFVMDADSGMLEYFEKEEHKKQRPRGCVHLAGAVISPSDEDSQTFSVSAANGEIYRLKAGSTKERQLWIDKLRTTAEYHTNHMTSGGQQALRRESRSSSLLKTITETGSTRRRPDTASQDLQQRAHKAPAPRPHTLDPFREVKEYISEANDYAVHLREKIDSLSVTAEPIGGLDKDLLLLKATSAATLNSLGHCLQMLQHQQGGAPYDWHESFTSSQRHISISSSIEERNGSFSSVTSAPGPIIFPEEKPEGPINHEDEEEDEKGYTDEDLSGVEEHKTIILHLLSQLKLGMDLTKVVLPTFILERRSLLEMFADCMAHPDMFLKIPDLPDPESRMLAVIEWYLTSFHAARQGSVAKKPYNPIIGETFHCSWKIPKKSQNISNNSQLESSVDGVTGSNGIDGSQPNGTDGDLKLVYCAEQVSHHPPISAFYFECPEKQMCMNASIYTKSRFYGMSIGVNLIGKVSLRLLQHGEEYVFGMPSAYARSILTVPWAEMGDKISISCAKTGYSAAVTFHTKPFYGGKLHRVSAEVKDNSGEIICRIQGEWNSQLEFTYKDGSKKTIDVKDIPIRKKRVRPVKLQGDFESRRLWQHVTNALKVHDVNTASEHKRVLEERQREGERHRKETGTPFPTKFFHKEDDGWLFNTPLQKGDTKGTI
ncbi:oxysterol-binding protein-related protein 11-like isoform X2 [Saccostrea echinata]|uniref:oxysterol-binding protein-related protein 11-like isoform X2 n=1 Tax=Saccostrea echinata TaxID=191078 RepID=UPI002A826A35|nr:oxysterol-binding protein-related protein 11-like isoform X2 [Saccostrea echinata]